MTDNAGRFDSDTGRAATLTRWAFETDRHAATAPARDGFRRRFERLVDPDESLPDAERRERTDRLIRAHMIRLRRRRRRL